MNHCPICFNEIKTINMCQTNCGHYLCKFCLQKWIAIKQNCPTCRESIHEYSYHTDMFKIIYTKQIENMVATQKTIDELQDIVLNTISYRKKYPILLNVVRITSFMSLFFFSSSIYLLSHCEHN